MMNLQIYTLLSHPLTITGIVIVSGAIGWAISTLIVLIKDNSTLTQTAKDIKELLISVIEEQRLQRRKIDEVRSDLDALQGEHTMMMRAGDMIGQHDFKKKQHQE